MKRKICGYIFACVSVYCAFLAFKQVCEKKIDEIIVFNNATAELSQTARRRHYDGDSSRRNCVISCTTGVPCEYPEELDFRIIVLTYNRPESLRKCLSHIAELDTLGDQIGVDIWIDRSKNGQVNKKTVDVARTFRSNWTRGQVCVHVQQRHAGIIGQWIDTWRPRQNSKEIALFLEDDIDISRFAYRWLRLVDRRFRTVPDVAGYTLQMENVNYVKGGLHPITNIPKTDNVFIYRRFATWGFSPKPNQWRNFQDWVHEVRKNKTFKPYLPGTVMDMWYKQIEKKGKADSVWAIWFSFYCDKNNLYTVFSNLQKYTGKKDTLLDTNRKEAGLHFGQRTNSDYSHLLLNKWSSNFEIFPDRLPKHEFDGKISGIIHT